MTEDRKEVTSAMEPMLISEGNSLRNELADLALDLTHKSTSLRKSLPDRIVVELADLVRSMNCYYSNLIEGHDTHPVDIERALHEDYSTDPRQRDLQLEARAHISVQAWIDSDGLDEPAFAESSVLEIHRRFCELLPEDLLYVDHQKTKERIKITPGEFRHRDVAVGQHIPISPGALPRFMKRFDQAYRNCGRVDAVIAPATAHHRLLWLHPFLDGNGRVARLMSHAMLNKALDTGGIWSVSRGLARNESAYKKHLQACDSKRKGDLDGRGALSESALAEFAEFFLITCIDQVDFMASLIQPQKLRQRILIWAEEEIRGRTLPAKSGTVLEAILYRGELPRGDIPGIVGTTERQARRITSTLLDAGVLTSSSARAPLILSFPASLASRWMPGLFPDKSV